MDYYQINRAYWESKAQQFKKLDEDYIKLEKEREKLQPLWSKTKVWLRRLKINDKKWQKITDKDFLDNAIKKQKQGKSILQRVILKGPILKLKLNDMYLSYGIKKLEKYVPDTENTKTVNGFMRISSRDKFSYNATTHRIWYEYNVLSDPICRDNKYLRQYTPEKYEEFLDKKLKDCVDMYNQLQKHVSIMNKDIQESQQKKDKIRSIVGAQEQQSQEIKTNKR